MRRRRTVVEDMAEMSAATRAVHFRPLFTEELEVVARLRNLRKNRPERRPAVAAVVLYRRRKERLRAAGATVYSRTLLADERARERRFRSVATQDREAVLAEEMQPLGFGMLHAIGRGAREFGEDRRSSRRDGRCKKAASIHSEMWHATPCRSK